MDSALPGASAFMEYLKKSGEVSVDGPKFHEDNRIVLKEWDVYLDGKFIGKYSTDGPMPRDKEFERRYDGMVPNHSTKATEGPSFEFEGLNVNVDRSDSASMRHVNLLYSNRTLDGTQIRGEWKRRDNHSDIPFP